MIITQFSYFYLRGEDGGTTAAGVKVGIAIGVVTGIDASGVSTTGVTGLSTTGTTGLLSFFFSSTIGATTGGTPSLGSSIFLSNTGVTVDGTTGFAAGFSFTISRNQGAMGSNGFGFCGCGFSGMIILLSFILLL
jgi:hypothetical protein